MYAVKTIWINPLISKACPIVLLLSFRLRQLSPSRLRSRSALKVEIRPSALVESSGVSGFQEWITHCHCKLFLPQQHLIVCVQDTTFAFGKSKYTWYYWREHSNVDTHTSDPLPPQWGSPGTCKAKAEQWRPCHTRSTAKEESWGRSGQEGQWNAWPEAWETWEEQTTGQVRRNNRNFRNNLTTEEGTFWYPEREVFSLCPKTMFWQLAL